MNLLAIFLFISHLSWAKDDTNCERVFKPDSIAKMVTWSGPKSDKEYKHALRLLSENREILTGEEPYVITFNEFVEGLKYLKAYIFDSVEDFVRWKTKRFSKKTNKGTKGYKAFEFVVAVKLKNEEVVKTSIFLFDRNGDWGDHRGLAQLAGEAFPQGQEHYKQAWKGQYYAQVLISKFKDDTHVTYLHTDSFAVRVHAQNHLDEKAPISSDWGEILMMPIDRR